MSKDIKIELKDSERQPCEIWTRVMGYHRPIDAWNIGKRQEFAERKYFKESKATSFLSKQEEKPRKAVA